MKLPQLPAGEIARRTVQSKKSIESATAARATSIATKRVIQQTFGVQKTQRPPRLERGQQIFVFNHLPRNHVVYSLTRAMNNNAALAQLPFNGKKSVPSALRKDLWQPLAHIKFPPGAGAIGLSAFQKLREYRRRHELEWGDEIALDKDGKYRKKKDRRKAICDQKANSVADMAAVLNRLAVPSEGEGPGPQDNKNIGLTGAGSGTKVEIQWKDVRDAEFAKRWALNVEHAPMPAPPRPGSKRQVQRREIAELRAGGAAAMREFAEAQREKKAEADRERDAADPEWRTKLTPEERKAERETEKEERAAEIKKIKVQFKAEEQTKYYQDIRAAEAASKFAQKLAKEAHNNTSAASTSRPTIKIRAEFRKAERKAVQKLAKLAKEQAASDLYNKRMAERAEKIASDPTWYEKVKAEGAARKAEKLLNNTSAPTRKPKRKPVRDPAKPAKEQAARDLYNKRMAEQAERIAGDPAWYEKVKKEGMARKAEKNLL